MHLRLPHRLRHGALQPLRVLLQRFGRQRLRARQFHRPRARQQLIKQILLVPVRRRRRLDVAAARAQYPAPDVRLLSPLVRQLRQHRQPRPRIFAALGVVRGGGQHGIRPPLRPLRIRFVEARQRAPELRRIAAHLIQRHKPVVAIERRILQTLRHHGTAVLLQLHRASQHRVPAEAAAGARHQISREQPAHKIEGAAVHFGHIRARQLHRPVQIAPVFFRGPPFRIHVNPIDRKAGHHLANGTPQHVVREIRRLRPVPRHLRRLASQYVQFARHLIPHDPELTLAHHFRKALPLAREIREVPREAFFARRIDQNSQHQIGELIAGGSLHRPILPQALMLRQNLFHHQIKRPAGFRRPQRAQPLQILPRIQQSVDVVDPQPVQRAVAQHPEDQRMRIIEHVG